MKRPYLQRCNGGRINFRVKAKHIQAMPGLEGSAEFEEAYQRLVAAAQAGTFGKLVRRGRQRTMPAPELPPAIPATAAATGYTSPQVGFVAERFIESKQFEDYRPGTRRYYRLALDFMRKEIGELPLPGLTPDIASRYVQKIRDGWNATRASLQKKLLSILWVFALNELHIKLGHNPMRDVKEPYEAPEIGHKAWPLELRARFASKCAPN
jgi:hypothetical protein